MATERPGRATVQRYGRRARWVHAATYLTVLTLLGTGVWLLLGHEGSPSPLSRLAGVPDARLHVWVGWAFVAVLGVGLLVGVRGAVLLVRESVRFRRGDLAWFRAWPRALVTGRFPWHGGHFDPGQRVANVVLLLDLAVLTASGVAMAMLHGGPAFVWLVPTHTWATYLLVPLVGGHVLIASGVLPGYRGVWRSMHLGGRLPVEVARRVWPGWTDHYARRHGDSQPRTQRAQGLGDRVRQLADARLAGRGGGGAGVRAPRARRGDHDVRHR